MICPICQNETSDNSGVCSRCGSVIPRCPTCGRVIPKRMAFCTRDGTRLPDEVIALFDHAAAPQDDGSTRMEQSAPQDGGPALMEHTAPQNAVSVPRGKGVPKEVIFGFLALACLAIGLLAGGLGKSKDEAGPSDNTAQVTPADSTSVAGTSSANMPPPATPAATPAAPAAEISPATSEPYPDEGLFSSDASRLVAEAQIMGYSLSEAVREQWGEEWICLYYYGSSDPSPDFVESRTHNISLDMWLRDYITYERAQSAGWGDEWLSLIGSLSGGTGYSSPEEYGDSFLQFVENCDSEYFYRYDLNGFSAEMAVLARNAPYAHAGRKFSNDNIRRFFEQFSWYAPRIEPDAFQETMLNSYETHNKDLVVAYEKEMGYK